MTRFKLSQHDRERYARNKRERYRRDPAYRLARINSARIRNGRKPVASLDQVETRIQL